jgi:hypothetical protein
MPSTYQQQNLEAMLGLFFEAQGHPLPEHSKSKSEACSESVPQCLRLVNPQRDSCNWWAYNPGDFVRVSKGAQTVFTSDH